MKDLFGPEYREVFPTSGPSKMFVLPHFVVVSTFEGVGTRDET